MHLEDGARVGSGTSGAPAFLDDGRVLGIVSSSPETMEGMLELMEGMPELMGSMEGMITSPEVQLVRIANCVPRRIAEH